MTEQGWDPGPSEDRSIGTILGDVTENLSRLMRQELELAKAELQESAAHAGRAGGMVAVAAVAAQLTLLFLSLALWWALGDLIGLGWSALVVGILWGIVAAVLALRARDQVRQIRGLPQTTQTVKKIPNALQGHEEQNR
ncbi:phage holin family protein [Cellulomonas fimi]|uniref:Integral membrane protein n=1 Tax=Cellulomonas fimi (strain ATCC 484 / DSM 20113 / JCM 1341 / CCUG 24087 / LMG 16345 / NBRC 15513 / NCIMB 8980 / NCTC 7547 / NRS-133) TaxID=590998 RepID=F4H3B9_CELFA|nr:phage holin family protein [Cellulomonas fimi]AEE45340.1 putative protein of unknown function (DUF1469) [Cellulomonas fimi ATCC 484]NNH08179.1 phage holin family protein [Cellulomonas fimi]VEH29027.1 Protein of uncharacterised function (DUF1469) [Cellulomonas fimi]